MIFALGSLTLLTITTFRTFCHLSVISAIGSKRCKSQLMQTNAQEIFERMQNYIDHKRDYFEKQ